MVICWFDRLKDRLIDVVGSNVVYDACSFFCLLILDHLPSWIYVFVLFAAYARIKGIFISSYVITIISNISFLDDVLTIYKFENVVVIYWWVWTHLVVDVTTRHLLSWNSKTAMSIHMLKIKNIFDGKRILSWQMVLFYLERDIVFCRVGSLFLVFFILFWGRLLAAPRREIP